MILQRKKGTVCRNNENAGFMVDTVISDLNSGEKFNSYADFIMELVEKNSEASGIDGKQAALPEINKKFIINFQMT